MNTKVSAKIQFMRMFAWVRVILYAYLCSPLNHKFIRWLIYYENWMTSELLRTFQKLAVHQQDPLPLNLFRLQSEKNLMTWHAATFNVGFCIIPKQYYVRKLILAEHFEHCTNHARAVSFVVRLLLAIYDCGMEWKHNKIEIINNKNIWKTKS